MANHSSMKNLTRSLSACLTGVLVVSSAALAQAPGPEVPAPVAAQETVRYARVGAEGISVLNIPDGKGLPVKRIKAGGLMRVHRVSAAFAEVEVPGGLEVWVYGRYLKPVGVVGEGGYSELMDVVGDGVNMRPRPEAITGHFPLGQRLKRGQRVRVIGRCNAELPAAEDWFHIFSPTGVRGWVRAKQMTVAGKPEGADWQAEWTAADALNAVTVMDKSGQQTPASTAGESDPVAQAMATAETLWSAARAERTAGNTNINWAAVNTAFEEVVALDEQGAAGRLATERMLWIDAQQEVARLRLDLLEEHERRMAEAEALRDEMRLASLARDPLWGRFRSRGWLEKTKNAAGDELWRLIWGGSAVAEVGCSSGRYDLELFAGFEVGVMGATLAPATPSAPAYIDVTRIEVISSRYR